ncbi:hypothetical protein MUG84_20895 [Paenibacillus sp. KQZ6P-2]|uniref:Uncharacterized protein n=1 Tax=Paenibacillus mangrovi TaxID=2931978 RepID=A0A9X1WV70_9BACL|nr:hypothetical protein [Paenibacillus mangrovi]MCJ8014173.1 hypothetical protein [Paenibacillus mangrovi]
MAGFKRKHLSSTGKQLLDYFVGALSDQLPQEKPGKSNVDRPFIIRLALAKGLSSHRNIEINDQNTGDKWEIPDIFTPEEYTLYSHIIINQSKRVLNTDEINNEIAIRIEKGLRILDQIQKEKNSLDDLRLAILTMN